MTAERFVAWGAIGSRSSVVFDIDNDGDLDIVTNDFNSEPMVLASDLSTQKSNLGFLKVHLSGTESNRNGLGATVRVFAGSDVFTKVHDGQSGYLSQSSCPLYFGLGDHGSVDRIEVVWPSGRRQSFSAPIETNRTIHIAEHKSE